MDRLGLICAAMLLAAAPATAQAQGDSMLIIAHRGASAERPEHTLAAYEREAHIDVIPGTGHRLLSTAVESKGINRRVVLQLPGYLGLSVITRTTDLIATLPRQMGETLAGIGELSVFACPFFIPSFVAKQHWHARVHHDAANRWLRGICADLLQKK